LTYNLFTINELLSYYTSTFIHFQIWMIIISSNYPWLEPATNDIPNYDSFKRYPRGQIHRHCPKDLS